VGRSEAFLDVTGGRWRAGFLTLPAAFPRVTLLELGLRIIPNESRLTERQDHGTSKRFA